jgi:hypothetical protein
MFHRLRHRLGIAVLGTLCVAGCSHTSSSATLPGAVASQPAAPARCTTCQYVVLQAGAVGQPVVVSQNQPAPQADTAVQQAAAWQEMVDPPSAASPAPQTAVQLAAVTAPPPLEERPSGSSRGEKVPVRRSYPDITSSSSFCRAPDYSWLSGQITQTRLGKGWRLRYAWVDEDDAYGGSVSLIDDPNLPAFKDGQMIRVTGHLVDAQCRGGAPAYRVETVESIK